MSNIEVRAPSCDEQISGIVTQVLRNGKMETSLMENSDLLEG